MTSHVRLCLYSRLIQLCKPMQVSSCRLSWFVGQGSTQRMIFYNKKKKKSNRFGRNRYIYKKKKNNAYLFWMKIFFFREKYTCVLLFLGCFSFSCVLSVSRKCHWWVSTHYCVYLTVRVWHAVQLAGPEIHERSTRTVPPIRREDASWISVVYPRVAPTRANSVERFSSAPSYISN